MGSYTKSWLKVEEELGVRPALNGNAEQMRAQHHGLMSALTPQYPCSYDSIKTTDGKHGSFNYRVYCPVGATNELLPVGVYYHPGGLVVGPSIADEHFCSDIAARNNIVIVAIKYRLSPEHKAPAHLEDAVKGLEWAHQNATGFGGNANRLYAIGVSAGAGLAVSASRKISLGQSSLEPGAVKGIVALCPVTLHPDNIPEVYSSIHVSSKENRENVPLVDGISIRLFFDLAGLDKTDVDYFPALDPATSKMLPPTYIVTCELDSLRDDGAVLADSLRTAGVSFKTDHYPGLPHCFWVFPSLPESEDFMTNVSDGIRWVVSQPYSDK